MIFTFWLVPFFPPLETLTAPAVGFDRGSKVSPCTNVVSAAMPSPGAPVASSTTLVVVASFDVVVGGLAWGLAVPYISVDPRLRYDTYWHGLVAGEEGGAAEDRPAEHETTYRKGKEGSLDSLGRLVSDRLQGVDVIAFLVDVHRVGVVICNEKENYPEYKGLVQTWN